MKQNVIKFISHIPVMCHLMLVYLRQYYQHLVNWTDGFWAKYLSVVFTFPKFLLNRLQKGNTFLDLEILAALLLWKNYILNWTRLRGKKDVERIYCWNLLETELKAEIQFIIYHTPDSYLLFSYLFEFLLLHLLIYFASEEAQ